MQNKTPEYPTPRRIMGEAIERLHGVRREVYLLTVRDGKSMTEAAQVLGMDEFYIQTYKNQAIRRVERYCKQAMTKGRI